MKTYSLYLYTFFVICMANVISFDLHAQKPVLDYESIKTWPDLTTKALSNDGKYVLYNYSSINDGMTWVVQAIDRNWRHEFKGSSGDQYLFAEDSRYLAFNTSDSVGVLDLQCDTVHWISHARYFKVVPTKEGAWLAYITTVKPYDLILININTGVSKQYPDAASFICSKNGYALAFWTGPVGRLNPLQRLYYLNLQSLKADSIAASFKFSGVVIDNEGRQLAFLDQPDSTAQMRLTLRYWKEGMSKTLTLADANDKAQESSSLTDIISPHFSPNGMKLYFSVKRAGLEYDSSDVSAKLDIWKSEDDLLRSVQIERTNNYKNRFITAVVALRNPGKVFYLNTDRNTFNLQFGDGGNAKFALVTTTNGGAHTEGYWRNSARLNFNLVSTEDDSSILIKKDCPDYYYYFLSPTGRFVAWFDQIRKNWLVYDISTGLIINLARGAATEFYRKTDMRPEVSSPYGTAAWFNHDSIVWLYDKYDIWQCNLYGVSPIRSVTTGFGKKHSIELRMVGFVNEERKKQISDGEDIFLSAFDPITKDGGFYKIQFNGKAPPVKLTMGPFAYYHLTQTIPAAPPTARLIKAKNTVVFVLTKRSATEYPNILATSDFVKFTPITNFEPQKKYNWLTSELIHWKMPDGAENQGILYKPENFDPGRKYPVIFYCYEEMTDDINLFMNPALTVGTLTIPWYVSNGYIVLVPDIRFRLSEPGQSMINALVSGAKYLAKFPYVGKIGVQGHSFGGYEVNYLIGKSNLFAAAASSAGVADLIDLTYSLAPGSGEFNEPISEKGQFRLGGTLWQNPNAYIENSPIFYADKVNTPLLLMHNQMDGSVPWSQSVEYFLALRRLGKKVWMLQYHNEGHVLEDDGNRLDFSMRLSQFFDYYLKDRTKPEWMK